MFKWFKKKFGAKKLQPKKEIEKKIKEVDQSPPSKKPKDVLEVGRLLFLQDVHNVEILDLRHEQPNPPDLVRGRKRWKTKNGKVLEREPGDIDTIVVHQTAVRFSVSEAAVAAAGGDRRLALARRGKAIPTHITAFEGFGEPFVAWINPLEWYMWHGNGFNENSLGIEIDGDFAGLKDNPSTAYKKKNNPDVLTEKHRAAACRGIKLLVDEGRKLGMPIKYIVAHRQSSPTRRSDPGEQIWKEVVLDYAVRELGLETRADLIEKKGYTIPKQWQEDADGDYWDEPKR